MLKYGKSGLDFCQMLCYNIAKGEQMFKNADYQRLHCVSIRELNPICLKLVKFAYFQFVVLERRQPIFVLRMEIMLNFSAFKVEEFKNRKF